VESEKLESRYLLYNPTNTSSVRFLDDLTILTCVSAGAQVAIMRVFFFKIILRFNIRIAVGQNIQKALENKGFRRKLVKNF